MFTAGLIGPDLVAVSASSAAAMAEESPRDVKPKVLGQRQVVACKFDPKSDCSFYGFDKLRQVVRSEGLTAPNVCCTN